MRSVPTTGAATRRLGPDCTKSAEEPGTLSGFISEWVSGLDRNPHPRSYSPELQPAETLWTLVDEPVVSTVVPNLDKLIDTITERCSNLTTRQAEISLRTNFAWWPANHIPS